MEDVDLATAPDIAGIDFSADLRKIDSRRPMQHVTAFSRPETVPPVSATMPKRKLWILNSWRDLILYVGTPLLIIPLFAVAQARWSAQEIYIFVAAFGALGHHLPGMIRAYGDRALFERFRWRFIVAPVRGLRRLLFVGHQDESGGDDRFSVGRLARNDADLRLRPDL